MILNPRYLDAKASYIIGERPNGSVVTIPTDTSNPDYVALVASGVSIAPFVPENAASDDQSQFAPS